MEYKYNNEYSFIYYAINYLYILHFKLPQDKRIDMALKGTLGDFPLPDIFQLIIQQRKSGILTVESDKDNFKIGLENGNIVMAEYLTRAEKDYLGEMLIKAKLINENQLNRALDVQKETLKKIGEILINDLKIISQKELSEFLTLQIQETVFKLFTIKDGQYEFQTMKVDYDKEFISPLSSEFLLMEGMRIIDEWPQIKKYVPSFNVIFKSVNDSSSFGKEERRIYELVDGIKSVRYIIDIGRMGEFETCYILSKLVINGFIESVEEKISEEVIEEEKVIEEKFEKRNTGIIYAIIAIIIVILTMFKFGIISSNEKEILYSFIKEMKTGE